MIKSLTGKLVFVGAIALAFTTVYISSEHYFTQHIRGEATRINLSGHLRFRSFEIAWLLHQVKEKNDPELKKTVRDRMEEFETIAQALMLGRKDMGVKAVTDSEEKAALEEIINKWKGRIRPMVMEVLGNPDKAVLARYDSDISRYVHESNILVDLIETHFKDEIRKFDIFRAYALSLFLAVSLFIAYYIRKFIILPVAGLKVAAKEIGKGNFDEKIEIRGNDDIGILAGTMNEMVQELKGARTNLECLVQQRTEELAAANEQMMAANEELQAAYAQLEAASADLETANEELKSIERLKTEFLQTISHELRSPLSPILGYLELMREGDLGKLAGRQKEVVEEMHICAKNMQMIVDELLEVASIQAGNLFLEFDKVNIETILSSVISEIEKYADERMIDIETKTSAGPLDVAGDRKSMKEIFSHLIRNAIKFNRERGKVLIEVAGAGDYVMIRISDTGIGIPKDKLDRIYEAFYQVESSSSRHYEGVGLGLYLVKRLVDTHNGRITVESKEGTGSIFTLFIPIDREKVSPSPILTAEIHNAT